MKISAAELRKRIEEGEDLDEISVSLISPDERELLKCCAVVRTFDEKLVDTYFRPQVPGADKQSVPFSRLTSHDFVQRVPRTEDVYFLLPAARKQYYDSWWESSDGNVPVSRPEVPESLRKLSLSLIEHYAALGNAGNLDLLAQLVFVDKEKARQLFDELYKKADKDFDLARCRDIINVLTGLEDVLGTSFAKTLNDTDRYLRARTLWAAEYYQTVNYYDRDDLTRDLEAFLANNAKFDPGNKWILHLHAPGGMGKTMFVRWLLSRRCLPEPYRVPFARVDFDFVDRITASQHRWRLFVDMARELDVQIPGYFGSLISKFSEFERNLHHLESQQASPTQIPARDKLEEDILYLFTNAVLDADLNKPIILIFDTLEEVILYHPDDLLEIVRMVNQLREANVLLVLSGRYDLTEKIGPDKTTRLPQFNKEFGDDFMQTVRVKPFEREEALGFLKMRGLTEDRPLDIVIKRSEQNPFKLALFADLLLDDPEITAETIRGYPSSDLLYLIERVLARIPDDDLHWLLRYGVVPRKLTFSFLQEVIKPHLERALAGDRSQDDPSRYGSLTPRARATVEKKNIFGAESSVASPVRLLSDDQLKELWTKLQNYASRFAWVTMEPSDPYTAGFHGDVVNPMRRWLEENSAYTLLHQDALEYFEKKAETDPNNWARWMGEAVYHKFQLEGAQAAGYWRQLITAEEDPSRRREIASEVIKSEYVDENFKPRSLLNGQQIITPSTLVEAYYEVARACVGMARAQSAPASDPLWSNADYDLEKCEQLQKELDQPAVSPAYLASVRAAILTSQNLGNKAIAILENVLEQDLDDRALLRLEAELANAYSSQENFEKAIFYWESALQRAERTGRTPRFIVETRKRLARLLRDQHHFEASAQNLLKALDVVHKDDAKTRAEVLNELGDVYFEMGQFSQAREFFEFVHKSVEDPALVADLRYLNQTTRYFLAVEDPRQALGVKEIIDRDMALADRAVTDDVRKVVNVLSIQSDEQRGMLHSMLFEVESAREAFEKARSRWREIGDSKAAKRCMLKKVELFLKAGEVNQASATLDEANRLTIDHDPEQWLQELLLRLRIWYFRREWDRLETGIQVIEKRAADERWGPTLRARLILGVGNWKFFLNKRKAATEFFSELTATLKEIEPSSLRMLLLDPLSEYPSFKDIGYRVAEDLLGLFPLPKEHVDFNTLAPRLAELLRVVGRKDHAVSLLKELISSAPKENSFALRRVLLTLGRTSPRHGKRSDVMKFVKTFLDDYEAFPVLCGSTLVELAELSFAARSAEDRLDLLDQAEELLKTRAEDSQWMARLLALRGTLTIKNHRKQALDQFQRAISISKELGNKRAVGDLEKFIETKDVQMHGTGAVSDPPPIRQEQELVRTPKMTVLIEDRWTESITIRTVIPGESEVITRQVAIQPASLLDDLLAFETYENYSFKFLRQIDTNWIATCHELGRILLDEKQVQKLQEVEKKTTQKSALRLIIKALQLSSAPWELMVLPWQSDGPASISTLASYFYRSVDQESIAEIIWLQRALSQLGTEKIAADRVYGRQTEGAVRTFQREHDLPDHGRIDGRTRRAIKRALHASEGRERPRVLLLRPGIERQRAISRGQQVYGLSLDDWYRREGFRDFFVIEDPHLEIVERALYDITPDVVHICPTMEESTSVGIYLDFGSGGTGVMPKRSSAQSSGAVGIVDIPSGDVQFLTLTAVSELVRRQLKQDRARPLLILDVLQPAGQTELFTQLFLRNAFAAQLYQLGAFESIIATGLTPPELQEEMSRTLIKAIASFESVGDTINRLRRLVDVGSYTHLLPVGGIAAPLRDPSDRRYLSTVVATAGTALFTQDPDM